MCRFLQQSIFNNILCFIFQRKGNLSFYKILYNTLNLSLIGPQRLSKITIYDNIFKEK